MRNTEDIRIKQCLEEEHLKSLVNDKKQLRDIVKNNIIQH